MYLFSSLKLDEGPIILKADKDEFERKSQRMLLTQLAARVTRLMPSDV